MALNNVSRIYPRSLRFSDIDDDGDLDVVASLRTLAGTSDSSTEEWEIIWYENTGNGEFGERQEIGNGQGYYNADIKLFDSDGDGYPEVSAFTGVFKNNEGTFSEAGSIPVPQAVADFNGDGAIDLISEDQWYENDGAGSYTAREPVSGTPVDSGWRRRY